MPQTILASPNRFHLRIWPTPQPTMHSPCSSFGNQEQTKFSCTPSLQLFVTKEYFTNSHSLCCHFSCRTFHILHCVAIRSRAHAHMKIFYNPEFRAPCGCIHHNRNKWLLLYTRSTRQHLENKIIYIDRCARVTPKNKRTTLTTNRVAPAIFSDFLVLLTNTCRGSHAP